MLNIVIETKSGHTVKSPTVAAYVLWMDEGGIIMYIMNALILQMSHIDLFHFNFCCQIKVIIDTFSSKYFHLLTNIDT